MEQKFPTRFWAYLLLLASFFGILLAMGVIFPHYEQISKTNKKSPQHNQVPAPPHHAGQHEIAEQKDTTIHENPIVVNHVEENKIKEFFTSLKSKYQTEVINRLTPGKQRTDIIIRYYKHPPDGNKVYALRNLGFYIHERPTDPQMKSYESNSLYYGDSVKREDLLIVAYTLIQQGIPIKNIQRSIFHDGWKANSIEIGTDTTAIEKDILSLEELKSIPY